MDHSGTFLFDEIWFYTLSILDECEEVNQLCMIKFDIKADFLKFSYLSFILSWCHLCFLEYLFQRETVSRMPQLSSSPEFASEIPADCHNLLSWVFNKPKFHLQSQNVKESVSHCVCVAEYICKLTNKKSLRLKLDENVSVILSFTPLSNDAMLS